MIGWMAKIEFGLIYIIMVKRCSAHHVLVESLQASFLSSRSLAR